jgi:hypothetical protein
MLKEKYKDENNCTVYTYVGYEVEYFKLMVQALNMSILYNEVPTEKMPGSYEKAINDVRYGFSDTTFGGYPLLFVITQVLDPTFPYTKESLKWYVPCGKPIPREKKVATIFTTQLWLTLFCLFMLVAVLMRWLSKYSELFEIETQSFRDMSLCLYNVWAVSMGVPVSEMPRSSRNRIVFLSLVWYCFVLSTVFQTYFTSILVNPGIIDQIRTIEELYQSDLVYLSSYDTDSLLELALPEYHQGIHLKKKECSNWEASMSEYLNSEDGAAVGFGVLMEYAVLSSVPDGSLGPQFCTLREEIFSLDYTMYFRKGSPLLGSFNNIIRRLMESGLIVKSTNDFKASFKYVDWFTNLKFPYQVSKNDNDYTVFSLYHLKIVFCVPLLGYVTSCIIFVGELLHFKLSN